MKKPNISSVASPWGKNAIKRAPDLENPGNANHAYLNFSITIYGLEEKYSCS